MPSTFTPLQPQLTSSTRYAPLARKPNATAHNFLRDQFTLQTWLAIGALAQVALFALPIKTYYAATPVIAYLIWTLSDHFMMYIGVKENIYETDAIYQKYTAILPDEDGKFTKVGAKADKVAVFMLGFKSHHMFGAFAPGVKEIGDYASGMYKELSKRADEFGFLGMHTFRDFQSSTTGGLTLTMMYFKSMDDVTRYAESPLHRKGWAWYNEAAKQHKHLGIMHELYEVPAGKWENISKNIQPTGLALTRHKVVDEEGEEKWLSPIVDASKGKLNTTYGRYGG